MSQIEKVRSELNELVKEHGLLHPVVLKKSKKLDKLLVQYMKIVSKK